MEGFLHYLALGHLADTPMPDEPNLPLFAPYRQPREGVRLGRSLERVIVICEVAHPSLRDRRSFEGVY